MRRVRRVRPQSPSKPPKSLSKPPKSPSKPTKSRAKKTTHKSTWKAFERVVAKDFGSRRTPLSGGNSGITRSDTVHDKLFVEAKLRQSFALHGLFVETEKLAKLEGKKPMVAIKEKSKKGYLILIRPEDLEEIASYYQSAP